MKKKILALMFLLILLAGGISACTSDKPDGETVSALLDAVGGDADESTATQPPITTTEDTTAAPTNPPAPPSNYAGKKLAAITFDDGPGPYTRNLIEELNKRGVKATFFMLGQQAEKYVDTVKYMYDSGHQLGSHTYTHKDITKISDDEFRSEMQKTDDAIIKGAGQGATAFRPPYGAFNKQKLDIQDKTPTHWSVDTMDWKNKNAELVKQNIVNNTKDGSIILLHDIYETSVQGALAAIDVLLEQGFQFVSVNELVTRNGDPITPHEIYFSCVPKKEES